MVAPNRRASWIYVVALAAMWLSGCNKEKLNELVEQGKQKLDTLVQLLFALLHEFVEQGKQKLDRVSSRPNNRSTTE